ncbi:Mov34/MPN/PAD-1 family protein [Virgibacillus sp. C22-A2]|uniref:Mov34/MPN/PAD-1 family protein n=1 Tax=Virgibacillus tibetensis TaxID=3042313 RepID=A0ABU6KGM2_9BACI|nr:Mov34/MPN/PAD-1 family protein [Virgibacillus sp. C22-A2]
MQTESIVIPEIIHNEMVENCKDRLPYEACGLLSGTGNRIRSLWQLENELKSATRFFVSKQSVEKTIQNIKHLEEQVLAIYHTHPITDPVPSSYDLRNHTDEKVFMVIISFKTNPPITKWYTIKGNHYTERLFSIES